MLSSFCNLIKQNKNLLMLITVFVYVLALFATLAGKLLLISIIVFLFFIYFLYKKLLPAKYIFVWIFLFYLGVINTTIRVHNVHELLNLAPINSKIEGTIVSIPQYSEDNKIKFFFDVSKITFESEEKSFKDEKVLITLDSVEDLPRLKLFNTAILEGRLSTPFKAGNPSQFDYGNYLRNHNTYAVFYASDIEVVGNSKTLKTKFLQRINDYRERILNAHSKHLPSPNLEILGGIVFGDDAVSPPKNVKHSFVNSGLLHILAASGMNVAFIYTFFFWIFSRLRVNYKLSVILGMLTVVTYSLMTGLGAAVVRATIMLLFVLVGKLIDRDAHSISLLSLVGLIMLIYNPLWINDVGFQLSFIVTLGILIMAPAFFVLENKIADFLISSISIPIIAQVWVIPIQIFYFNNISLYAVFANIMSVPILAVLSFGGFISSLLAGITPISDIVCKVFDFFLNPLLSIVVNISDFWGHLPNSSVQTSHPNILQIVVYYTILFALSGLLFKDFREKCFKKIVKTVVCLFVLLILISVPVKNSDAEIITFDVGNADSFLIKSPDNKYFMIDTGRASYKGGKTQAEIIILKYLKDRGIKKLDSLIITHFDNDHCGGAVDLIKNLNIKNVYVNTLNHDSISAKEIYNISKIKGVNLVLAKNRQFVYENKDFKIINYMGVNSGRDNESSIITLFKYKDFTMLFTGDASIKGIKSVLKDLPVNISVLKVPHHGANGGLDKSIINYLNPKYSIISVGENKFGHPALYTLCLLKDSKVFRTDVDNSIFIKISKKSFKIKTYDLKKRKYI